MDKQTDKTSKPDAERLPTGVYGYCATDNSGEEIEQKGQAVGALEEYGAYFNQLTALIADSLGFEETESTIIFGKKENVLCCEVDGVHYAATYKPKSSRREITDYFKGKENDDELFA